MHVEKYLCENIKSIEKTESIKTRKMCKKCIQKNILDFDVLICIQKSMACITSSTDLLYLIKTSWCRQIIFFEENLILFICPFCYLATVYKNEKDLQYKYTHTHIYIHIHIYIYIYIYIHIYIIYIYIYNIYI